MELAKVINNMQLDFIKGNTQINIQDIRYDSRQIEKDDLFICVQGFKTNGHKYIDNAIENGAKAVVIDKELTDYNDDITYIKVDDSREAMPLLAKNFFEDPLKDIDLIGVTGTNGKTTTTYLIKDFLN
jgi:UDP-N-acetylmuramoyl-L-alanyl-D-glutamate--2,6-diaminopimelate ligase